MESNTDIVLIGMMGAGKTTLGRSIANALSRAFFDSDEEIVKEQNRSIADIFKTEGEAYFRQLERRKIEELLEQDNIVLSIGGGAVTVPETAGLVFESSLTVWVTAPLETLVERVGVNEERPLLQGQDAKTALGQKLSERENLYSRADLMVVNDSAIENVTDNCVRQIHEYLLNNNK